MKNFLFPIVLVASLVFGSTLAFADSTAHQSGTGQTEMHAQKLKKGLKEAYVIANGKDSWVLHQPKENPRKYFLPNSKGKMAGGQSGQRHAKHQDS